MTPDKPPFRGCENPQKRSSTFPIKLPRSTGSIATHFQSHLELLVSFRVVQPLIAEYGVLTWRTRLYARHVFGPASILHAVNRPLIREVGMACNTPTHGYPDWSFTDPTATSIWRTTR